MDAFFAQSQEVLQQGYIQIIIVLYVAAQLWWWLRVAIAHRNKPYTSSFSGTYAIFMTIYRPDPSQLRRSLKSIAAHSKPHEFIVVIDDAPHAPKQLMSLAEKYATKVVKLPYRLGSREQYAAAVEALKKKSDVIITTSPDAIWDASTLTILNPFTDQSVGAVTGFEALQSHSSIIARLQQWFTAIHFAVDAPFQSYFGNVKPVSTRLLAARRDIFTTSVLAARYETFLGRRILTADGESLAARIIADGQRSVYQSTATITTPPFTTFSELMRDRLHRARGAMRSFIRHGTLLNKSHPLVTAATIFAIAGPIVYAAIGANLIYIAAYKIYEFTGLTAQSALGAIIIGAVAYGLLGYIRYIPLLPRRHYLASPLLGPVASVMSGLTKCVAFFTFAENNHTARHYHAYGEGKVGRARTAIILGALIIIGALLPLTYTAMIAPIGVPFDKITNQQGRAYATAQQLSLRLNDGNTTNDPAPDELTALLRLNSAHYNQLINDAVARDAHDCVRQTLRRTVSAYTLNETQACYATAQVVAENSKTLPVSKPAADPVVVIAANPGDTLTYLVRAQVKQLDQKHELSAAQAVFIETTYLSQMDQLNHYIDVGEQTSINTDKLKALVTDAQKLDAAQIAAWDCYTANIQW